jgi:hypothetical protein
MGIVLAQSCAMVVVGIVAVKLVGGFTSQWAFIGVFAAGAAIATIPFLWAYYRFVPLVVRGA